MTNYQLLLNGSIVKNKGNGHRFYDALDKATVDDLQRAQKSLERYSRHYGSHQAKRLLAIKIRLARIAERQATTP